MNQQRTVFVLPARPNSSAQATEPRQLRVAAYCRVSSASEEQLTSYQAQIRHYEVAIKTHPDYAFAGIFADEGISGTSIGKRPAFRAMIQACRAGQIDLILTKSVSRFGRNTVDCLKTVRELTAIGVGVQFEKENINTLKSESELLLTIMAAVAENESFSQSENVKWGIRRRYEQGKVTSIPGGKFLGYDKDETGQLIINETQAAVVRRIYQAFLDGFGTYQIARRLTTENVPMTYGGKAWCASHIRRVLTNEKIKGDTLCLKTFNADPLTKRRVRNHDQFPQHYFQDTHPAIIEPALWELVQLEFARQEQFIKDHRMDKYHHHSAAIPFSGKIICRACGRIFNLRETSREASLNEKYWRCSANLPLDKSCGNGVKLDENRPESAFIEAWNKLVDAWPAQEQPPAGGDLMLLYRLEELRKLVKRTGRIKSMPYELMLKVLDHIEAGPDGRMQVRFLAGLKIDVATCQPMGVRKPRWTHVTKPKSWMAQRRMQQNLTQSQLAAMVGVQYKHLLQIEAGRSKPSQALAKKLSAVLGVPWSRWFEEPIAFNK